MAVPQCGISSSVLFDTLWHRDPDGILQKDLIDDWTVSPDGLTWNLKLKQGIPFHGGGQWGDWSADDFLFSINNLIEPNSRHPSVPFINATFRAEGGHVTKISDYEIEVNTGSRVAFDFTWRLRFNGASCPVPSVSKKYIETVGIDEATVQAIGTGPWEFVEWSTNEIFRARAVENHWRKTPNFAELEIFQIPEESTRIANFKAGKLDTMQMALGSIPALVDVPGIKFKRYSGGLDLRLNIHGQWYVERDDRDFNPVRDSSKAWVSASADTDSPEWEDARKVREALSIAIDRQSIVDTILEGEGNANYVYSHWHGFESFFDDEMRAKQAEFNVDRAKQLLAEAGWGDGFEIDMALTQRSYPGGPAMGEAVCVMWEQINVRCQQERSPMTAFRPTFLGRAGQGVNTHDNSITDEPIAIITNILWSQGLVNMGIEHPDLDAMIENIRGIGDLDERFAAQRVLAKWMERNVINIPVVLVNLVWPIGPEIDVWELGCCGRDIASNTEFIPHRQ
jgi:peptide/nickel transport system substrate-binding protein